MTTAKLLLFSALLVASLQEIYGHGRLMDPINRSSVWRKYPGAPPNYNDNQNFCGGFSVQQANGGRCGPCGDKYRDPVPRANENGGKYGQGRVVKRYKTGEKIKVNVDLSANHKGYFKFSICKLTSPTAVETEECFDEQKLQLIQNGKVTDKFSVDDGREGSIDIELLLPDCLKCARCVLRWHYWCGNNWGTCPTGPGRVGCGPQETFRSCSDITIV